MTESMTRRVVHVLLPALHHGLTGPDISPEEFAYEIAQRVFAAMREPTDGMVNAGEEAATEIGDNRSPASRSYTAMIDNVLAEPGYQAPDGGE